MGSVGGRGFLCVMTDFAPPTLPMTSTLTLNPQRLDSRDADFATQLARLRRYPDHADTESIEATVTAILAAVSRDGDAALIDYTRRFDHWQPRSASDLTISPEACQAALAALATDQRQALETAAQRIHDFHQRQKLLGWRIENPEGSMLGQQVTAIDRVGLYVPGGKAAYPSSVLMNAIPAKVAGVGELIMVTPTPHGHQNQLLLAAAALTGVDRVIAIGGAQAIAALSFGTASVPTVDKIVGPGNAYVAAAKRRVFGLVGIDMVAGPSEILVIGDGSVNPDWVAMDLFSQAEHDELAQSILLSPDATYLDRVAQSMQRLLPSLPRAQVIASAINGRGALIYTQNLADACAIANRIAPEHLELALADPEPWVEHIRHAGAIFIGGYSNESLGDYCAGPNHVLPTSGNARFASPLGVYDFQKRSSLIRIAAADAAVLGRIASTLAYGEGLEAHARAAELRYLPD